MGPTECGMERAKERCGSWHDASSDREGRERKRELELHWIREGGAEEDTRRRVIEL